MDEYGNKFINQYNSKNDIKYTEEIFIEKVFSYNYISDIFLIWRCVPFCKNNIDYTLIDNCRKLIF